MSSERRLPRLALAAWSVAVAVLVALAVAVWRYLRSDGHVTSGSMAGMHMHDATDALTRAGTVPSHLLFGSSAPVFTVWHLDAVAVALIVLVAAWYLTGVALVPLRAPGTQWPLRHTLLFMAGLAVTGYATNGAIAVYDQVLFTAHMAGHLALVMVAPALLVAGRPLSLALAASAPPRRARIERVMHGRVLGLLTAPPVALASYTVVIVGSHLTGLMDTIMRNTWAGQVEHLVYLLVGCQFFALVIGDEPLRWRLATPARWLLLAVAMAVDTFTGVVLLQGTHAVAMLPSALDVNALSDTHTGGAIMWFGGDAIMAVVMIVLVVEWLRSADTRHADEPGFLEQARRATFAGHTGVGGETQTNDVAFDDDDAARASYNEWLARLDQKS